MGENLENLLSAFIDYICSYSIKQNNNEDSGIILVKGGKAFNEYIETPKRPQSYDWDVSYYGTLDNSYDSCVKIASTMQTLYNTYMFVAPLTIASAVNDTFPYFSVDISDLNVQFVAWERISQISGIKVSTIYMIINAIPPITVLEMTYVEITAPNLAQYKQAQHCQITIPNQILDPKRSFVSLDYLVDNLQTIILPNSTYPKKDKAITRLAIIEDAKLNKYMNCYIDKYCTKKIVYDATGVYNEFKSWNNIPTHFINRDYKLVVNNPVLFNSIITYTIDYSINTPLLKAFYFANESLINQEHKIMAHNMDNAFNFHCQDYLTFAEPIKLFRLTKYKFLFKEIHTYICSSSSIG